ncbi:MAG: hypothetical protein ACFFB2_08005 [Promethearchaeota archaeon]
MNGLTYNQIQYTIIALISLIITFIGLYLTISVYRKTKSGPLLFLVASHIILVPYYVYHTLLHTLGLYDVDLTIILYRASVILVTIVSFLLVMFIESLRSEKPSTIITMIVTFGTGVSIILCIVPDTFLWDPEIGPYFTDFSRLIFVIELIGLTLIIVYEISRFLRYIPWGLRGVSYLFFFGCLSPIIGPGILIATKLSLVISGIEILALALGILVIILVIVIDDRVLRLLPFNVYRLSVMNLDIGLSIFDVLFDAKKQGPDVNTLIPHLMTANLQFVQTIIAQTEKIRCIQTDNYIFIFEALQNVVTFIIADKISLLLRSALREFTKEFFNEFGSNLDSIVISQYSKAEIFINKYFSFLPDHRIVSISS